MRNTNAKIRNEARRRYDTFLTNILEMFTISHPEVLELFKKNAVSDASAQLMLRRLFRDNSQRTTDNGGLAHDHS